MEQINFQKLRLTLDQIYGSVPVTCCESGCDSCCCLTEEEWRNGWVVMFPLYSVEYMNITEYLRRHFIKERQEELFKFKNENPKQCPFLDKKNGGCTIYPVRPLTCRTYGVLNENLIEEAVERYSKVLPLSWVSTFARIERHSLCPKVTILDGKKLETYIALRITLTLEKEIQRLTWTFNLFKESKKRILEKVLGRSSVTKWTWGGFNRFVYLSNEDLESNLLTLKKNARLAS